MASVQKKLYAYSVLCLVSACVGVSSGKVCPSAEYLLVQSDSAPTAQFYLPLGHFGRRPPFKSHDGPVQLRRASPRDACSPQDHADSLHGVILLADRGSCTFVDKAHSASAAQAAGIVVINNSSDCLWIGTNATQSPDDLSGLFVASADNETGLELVRYAVPGDGRSADNPPAFRYHSQVMHVTDPAALVILAMAVFTIWVGTAWAGHDFALYLKESSDTGEAAERQGQHPASRIEPVQLSLRSVVMFVGLATCMMFLLFFILNRFIFWIFIVIFSYGSLFAMTSCVHALFRRVSPSLAGRGLFTLPRFLSEMLGGQGHRQQVTLADMASLGLSAAVLVLWLLNRTAPWAWTLQNVLGVSFMVVALRAVQLPDGRVATCFLSVLLLYDIFMVFVTPLFMPRGESVMVRVAKGGGANEIMPMLLLVPRLLPPLHSAMMMGYGDVVVPGLLISYLWRFDVALGQALTLSYATCGIIAYVCGVVLTDLALELQIGGSQGQPALLYLVPCTLGMTWVLAWWRGHVTALWTGFEDVKDHDSGMDDVGDQQAINVPSNSRRHSADFTETDRLVERV